MRKLYHETDPLEHEKVVLLNEKGRISGRKERVR